MARGTRSTYRKAGLLENNAVKRRDSSNKCMCHTYWRKSFRELFPIVRVGVA